MIQFDPYCYDSVTFYRFPREQSVLGDFLEFFFLSLRSNYWRKLYFYFYSFLWSLVCYAFQSIAILFAYRLVFLRTLLSCCSRFLRAFQKSRVQSKLLYLLSKWCGPATENQNTVHVWRLNSKRFSSFEFISGINERTLVACSRRASGRQHFLKKTLQMNELDHRILALCKQQARKAWKTASNTLSVRSRCCLSSAKMRWSNSFIPIHFSNTRKNPVLSPSKTIQSRLN